MARPGSGHRFGAAVILLTVMACSSIVPPTTRVYAPIDPDIPPLLYVVTARERETVLASLRQAGFSIATDMRDAPLVLHVRLGGSRSSKACGSVRNVVYDLRRSGVRVADIKGRGWTGTCQPNMLTQMSAELAGLFGRQP
jgi:hypothetical protein